jgi:tRNA A37 threonylcarbamoyladenosine dehydratase
MASLSESYLQRFGGIARLYGRAGLQRLNEAHVCVIGVGGVGSWIVEALARSGVGELTLIDMDDVCVTNINRQLPALDDTIGLSKVGVLAKRVGAINPECRVHEVIEFYTEANAARLLSSPFNFVIDAVDRMSVKASIISSCAERSIPVLTVGSAGGRRDPTQIRMMDLGFSGHDLLLQQVRRKLRRDHGFPKSDDGRAVSMGVPCVFSIEQPVFAWADGTCSLQEEPGTEDGMRLDCAAGFGAATQVTGAFAFIAVAELVRLLVSAGSPCAVAP